jgi:fumarylacetoacetase
MKTWLDIPVDSDFSIHNIPFGIASDGGKPFVASRLGDHVINLNEVARTGFFKGMVDDLSVFDQPVLNPFIALGKSVTNKVRLKLLETLTDDQSPLRKSENIVIPADRVKMHLPVTIGDYTDFYSSIEHATNVGMMFRDPANALLPNWRHLPVGYHGRSSSITVSGTPVRRPKGQTKLKDAENPEFGPTKKLDFELELGFVIGKETSIGESIATTNAEDYIFGLALFNDWSARDIQNWEYVPLGPFLAKNFASSLSPWIVTLEALAPYRCEGPRQVPPVLPYLEYRGLRNFDIHLEVAIIPEDKMGTTVSNSNFKYMYWNMCQQLAHHTSNGCNVRVGDLMASGTISGPNAGSYGSMLELSWNGANPVLLDDGLKRTFIEDGDTVTLRGWAEREGLRIGFGSLTNQVLPAV